jgi:hypothetical protein
VAVGALELAAGTGAQLLDAVGVREDRQLGDETDGSIDPSVSMSSVSLSKSVR